MTNFNFADATQTSAVNPLFYNYLFAIAVLEAPKSIRT